MASPPECVGPEFAFGPLGEMITSHPNPGNWPYLCGPSASSDLRTDPELGLWVPPRGLAVNQGIGQSALPITLPFNTYFLAAAASHTITNPSACFPLQTIVSCEISGIIEFTSADTWAKIMAWSGAGVAPSPNTLPVLKTLYNQFTTGVTGNDSFTVNLVQRVGLAPSASTSLFQDLWTYVQSNPGSTTTAAKLYSATSTFFSHGWLLTDGSEPVTDTIGPVPHRPGA